MKDIVSSLAAFKATDKVGGSLHDLFSLAFWKNYRLICGFRYTRTFDPVHSNTYFRIAKLDV